MAKEAPAAVIELENYGMPFSRTPEGKIYQGRTDLSLVEFISYAVHLGQISSNLTKFVPNFIEVNQIS